MPWISNHKHKTKDKATKSSQSSSKVVGLGLLGISSTDYMGLLSLWLSPVMKGHWNLVYIGS